MRRGLVCSDPIESTFYSAENPKSSMDPFYRTRAFGQESEGGVAPNGFCFACGSTSNILVLERLQLIESGAPTVYPLCASCKARGIEFRARKTAKTNYGKQPASGCSEDTSIKWVSGMLCMARFKAAATSRVLLYPALVKTCGKDGRGPFDIHYFDGDKATGTVPYTKLIS